MKPWYQSKTVLYNGAIFIAAIITALIAFMTELQSSGYVVSAGAMAVLIAVDKVINIVLRVLTTMSISKG